MDNPSVPFWEKPVEPEAKSPSANRAGHLLARTPLATTDLLVRGRWLDAGALLAPHPITGLLIGIGRQAIWGPFHHPGPGLLRVTVPVVMIHPICCLLLSASAVSIIGQGGRAYLGTWHVLPVPEGMAHDAGAHTRCDNITARDNAVAGKMRDGGRRTRPGEREGREPRLVLMQSRSYLSPSFLSAASRTSR